MVTTRLKDDENYTDYIPSFYKNVGAIDGMLTK
jgi:hypothetical protein